jgi:uncharacterized membrane protein
MDEEQIAGLILSASMLMNVLLGVPLALRRVAPNRKYGWRTPRTLSDEPSWYEANVVLGQGLIAAGVLGLAFLVAAHTGIFTLLPDLLLLIAVFALVLVVTVIRVQRALARLDRPGRPS